MSIQPLRRATTAIDAPAPRQLAVAGSPRRPVGQLCLIVTTLADGEGQAIVRGLRRRGGPRVVLLSRVASRPELQALLSGGVRGAIATQTRPSVIAAPIPQALPAADLSAREITVIRLVADGCSNKMIGDRLGLSALTVKSHLARVARKLNTGDRAAMVATAIRSGLIS